MNTSEDMAIDCAAYSQKVLEAIAGRFGFPFSVMATDYERAKSARCFAEVMTLTDRGAAGPLGHLRAMVALSLNHTDYDEMWRDAYALGRSQWG